MSDELDVGPVDYLVIEFPGNKMTGEGFPILVDLVDRGIIRILDLAFVRKDLDGTVDAMALTDFDQEGIGELAVFHGASSGLLDEGDVTEAGAAVAPGSSAAILVFENTWAGPFVTAMRHSGAELVASGRIPAADVMAAIEALDARG